MDTPFQIQTVQIQFTTKLYNFLFNRSNINFRKYWHKNKVFLHQRKKAS
jgi:hypothetical protein